MLYSYDAGLTLNGKGTHANSQLSAMDKSFIRMVYPPQEHDAWVFDTIELSQTVTVSAGTETAQSPAPGLFNAKKILFDPAYGSVPKMAIGLSRVDMKCKANKKPAARIDAVIEDHAIVSVSTWDDGILNGGAVTWIEAESQNVDWQFGEFNTQEVRDHNDTSSQKAEKVIYFSPKYSTPPRVIVVLKLFDLDNNHGYRVKAYATDITAEHFTIHIDTWGDSILYVGAVSWIAYPADLKSAQSISVTTMENQANNNARINFAPGTFVKKPEVRTFLSMIDCRCGADLRIKGYADGVTKDGFTWHADTWDRQNLHQAGLSIIVYA